MRLDHADCSPAAPPIQLPHTTQRVLLNPHCRSGWPSYRTNAVCGSRRGSDGDEDHVEPSLLSLMDHHVYTHVPPSVSLDNNIDVTFTSEIHHADDLRSVDGCASPQSFLSLIPDADEWDGTGAFPNLAGLGAYSLRSLVTDTVRHPLRAPCPTRRKAFYCDFSNEKDESEDEDGSATLVPEAPDFEWDERDPFRLAEDHPAHLFFQAHFDRLHARECVPPHMIDFIGAEGCFPFAHWTKAPVRTRTSVFESELDSEDAEDSDSNATECGHGRKSLKRSCARSMDCISLSALPIEFSLMTTTHTVANTPPCNPCSTLPTRLASVPSRASPIHRGRPSTPDHPLCVHASVDTLCQQWIEVEEQQAQHAAMMETQLVNVPMMPSIGEHGAEQEEAARIRRQQKRALARSQHKALGLLGEEARSIWSVDTLS